MHEGRRRERGVAAVLVAITLTALCGVGALAVDAGNAWQSRRELVTASDAAALAAAQEYAGGGTGCDATAETYVEKNVPAATMTKCDPVINGSSGSVTVEATQTVEYVLAGVFGIDAQQVRSSTTVRWGVPNAVNDLRPMGLCTDGDNDLINWLNTISAPETFTVAYTKDNLSACDSTSTGNWGLINFDGGSGDTNEEKGWILNGYPGEVTAGTYGETCATEDWACYSASTGELSGGHKSALDAIIASGEIITLPLFDWASPESGTNKRYHLAGFARAQLIEVKLGAEANRSLTLRFQPGLISGTCCGASSVDAGLRVVEICAVDPNDTSGC